jgi:hypothetical protein
MGRAGLYFRCVGGHEEVAESARRGHLDAARSISEDIFLSDVYWRGHHVMEQNRARCIATLVRFQALYSRSPPVIAILIQ